MEKYVGKKWLMMKEEITFKKTVGSTTATDLTNLGIFLCNFVVVGRNNTRAY